MAIRSIYILVFGLCLCTTVQSAPPAGSVYLDGNGSRTAVILCHGRGKHPQWLVVEPLRKGIHGRLGYHTLSLQMPNDNKSWKEYADDFPEAFRRIQAGIDFLRNEKGIKIIYLVGHSMGSRMASAFLAANPDAEIAKTLTRDQAIAEAKRCMSCGSCFECGECWSYCQDQAIIKPLTPNERYKFKMEFCNGCKKCAEQCPCGYIEMHMPGQEPAYDQI